MELKPSRLPLTHLPISSIAVAAALFCILQTFLSISSDPHFVSLSQSTAPLLCCRRQAPVQDGPLLSIYAHTHFLDFNSYVWLIFFVGFCFARSIFIFLFLLYGVYLAGNISGFVGRSRSPSILADDCVL